MKAPKLTSHAGPAHKAPLELTDRGLVGAMRKKMAMVCSLALSGCISVTAPDKPIVIELNINITQEVIYRLAADAQNTIEENADIF
jgi:hypothetical protein